MGGSDAPAEKEIESPTQPDGPRPGPPPVPAVDRVINTCYRLRVPGVPEDSVRPSSHRWVLLALQLPARPSNARVSIWRRLQQLGAVAIKHAVYVLPHSQQALEDFAWLRRDIEARGGQATVFTASAVEDLANTDIVEQFRTARAADYKVFTTELRRTFPGRPGRTRTGIRDLRAWRDRLEQIRQIDFFSAPGGSDAESRLTALERAARQDAEATSPVRTQKPLDRREYQGRTWVTRPRPGVDRFASAWFIQRFIDPNARFVFASERGVPSDAIPFDMYEDQGFGHQGDRCTFEVMQSRFAVTDRAVSAIAEIVHDVDLKDDRFHARHAPSVELLVAGLRQSIADDDTLLEHGIAMFEALYVALSENVATPRRKGTQR